MFRLQSGEQSDSKESTMGMMVKITSGDGFVFDAYRAEPEDTPRGSIVLIQEIFGVNSHIRAVADGYASEGYLVLAPAIFDRHAPGIELAYDTEGVSRGADIAFNKLNMSETLADLAATVTTLVEAGKVGVVGYCFGGLLAYLSANSLSGLACSIGYYGGGIAGVLDKKPKIPLMLHFGALDSHIPLSDVGRIQETLPEITVNIFPDADHGFNCDQRASYNAEAARAALDQSLAFFEQHLSSE